MVNSSTAAVQLADEMQEESSPWRSWLVFGLLALLIHLALLLWKFDWSRTQTAPRVALQQVDPRKLEAVKKQWRDREKALLLSKNQPRNQEAPEDARYMSDRNIRVEKEQRARNTDVLPHPNTQAPYNPQTQAKAAQPRSEAAPRQRNRFARLGNLGLPLNLNAQPRPKTPDAKEQQAAQEYREETGDQSLPDKTLPEGSENLLNAQESVYYSFYARIYEALAPVWRSRVREVMYQRPLNQGDYSTVVDAVFDADGRLVGVTQMQSSGITEFDQAVDESWKKVGRFPNPPKGLLDEEGRVHIGWTFTVQVDQKTGVNYLPPSRAY